MEKAKDDFIDGDKLSPTLINHISEIANSAGGFNDGINAGETISGATLPVAVHINKSDNEVYACDANDQGKLEFFGFAVSDSTDGNPITIQTEGVVSGFSGLTPGERYYVQDDKTIGLTPGTFQIQVGLAISATEIMIIKKQWEEERSLVASDTLQISADTQQENGSTTYTKVKEIKVYKSGTYRVKFGLWRSGADGGSAYGRIYKNGVAFGTERSTTETTAQTYTEDLAFSAGDLIQLYCKMELDMVPVARVNNFRLYFDLEFANSVGDIVTD